MGNCESIVDPCADANANDVSDIAGIGVLLAFLITAWFSVILAIVAYWTCCIPDELLTTYDKLFSRRSGDYSAKWTNIIRDAIMTLADQQIVTGIAILVAGFAQIHSLSIYLWQSVIYLAWMSSVVHLTSLTYLRYYLRERRALRVWRLAGMSALFCLLFAALYPTTGLDWECNVSSSLSNSHAKCLPIQFPARCYWTRPPSRLQELANASGVCPGGNSVSLDGVVSYLLLGITYLWKAVMLFDSAEKRVKRWSSISPLRASEKLIKRIILGRPSRLRRLLYPVTTSVYVITLAVFELAGSFAGSLWIINASLIWGTMLLVTPRIVLQHSNATEQENVWQFGQILPVLLLAGPLLTMALQAFSTEEEERAEEAHYHPLSAPSDQSSTGKSVKQLFASLDEQHPATRDNLHAAIYQSRIFKTILVLINLGIAGYLGFTFTSITSGLGVLPFLETFATVLLFCPAVLGLIAISAVPWSRLYR
ncbi:hypothetical protein BDY17DRAFT_304332 [Neohortaea acidophila]|uniref:Uncharacterized protein n=1 Tax=Neohortaea acidophila TaxID=245834 RepID=A0A6A6PI91_9PEZI|nr:uncharacterized protein BDY17DRAFT_304332 [Neohortaea acidophila]KAF2479645.1 hypothetical protein BDY17DRAFT_304332 [Neohortaea acidophila]